MTLTGIAAVLLPAGGTASAEPTVVTPPPGLVKIHPMHVGTAKCLGVDGGGAVGGQLKQFSCGSQAWKRFWFEELGAGSGRYLIHPATSSTPPLCLGVDERSVVVGALIKLQVCDGVENQIFLLQPPPEGGVGTLGRVVHSTLYIGVENGGTGEGIPVRQFGYDASLWKRFTLAPA